MRKSLVRALSLAAFALVGVAPQARAQAMPPARLVVERYVAAIGGRQALARQSFRHIVTEVSSPTAGFIMTIDSKFARPNKYVTRSESPDMGLVLSGFDGTHGWMMSAQTGPRLAEGMALQQLLRRADFGGSVDRTSSLATTERVHLSRTDGMTCYRVRMVSAQMDTVFGCFDVDTGLMSTLEMNEHPGRPEFAMHMRLSEYKEFGGVKVPTRITTWLAGQEMVTTVKSVSFAPIAPSEFTPPAEIRALIRQRPAARRN